MNDPENSVWLQSRVKDAERALTEAGIEPEYLDGLVQDCASEAAAEVNNNGGPAQLVYLLRNGWSVADIVNRTRMEKEDAP